MTERVFVDTNVLVYSYDVTEPSKRSVAVRWVDRLWHEGTGRVSVQVLNELYNTLKKPKLRQHVTAEAAWKAVTALYDWNPYQLDTHLLLNAHEIECRYGISWWDSLLVAAAQAQDCSVFLTEDLQDGMRFGDVVVQNPFGMKVREPAARYDVCVELPSSESRGPQRPIRQAA